MRWKNIVKIFSIIGFFVGIGVAFYVVLAPTHPVSEARMMMPKESIPVSDVPVGTEPPLGTKIVRLLLYCFFLGPFGAMAGCGVGLLVDGASRSFGKKGGRAGEGDVPAKEKDVPPVG